ncbi:MAG: hypothetical protein Q4C47_04075, partial [Planctomycetia bacterium]|nr:hypothetical protein [Planctomycetia bacterium]
MRIRNVVESDAEKSEKSLRVASDDSNDSDESPPGRVVSGEISDYTGPILNRNRWIGQDNEWRSGVEWMLLTACVAWTAGWCAEAWNRRLLRRIGVPEPELPSRGRAWITACVFAGIVVALWWMEYQGPGLFLMSVPEPGSGLSGDLWWTPSASVFATHVFLLLILWMVSLIDFDERIIPDPPVVIGTLGGLLAATFLTG